MAGLAGWANRRQHAVIEYPYGKNAQPNENCASENQEAKLGESLQA
jgi:hypothetical protein